jgi:hypothetical protein
MPYTHSITGEFCIGYLASHPSDPSVILSDESGRAIARVMGLTLDQAADFADQIVVAFNRQHSCTRLRCLFRHGTKYAIAGASVYALIIAVLLFL